MYTLEGISGFAGLFAACEVSVGPRLPFSYLWCVLCFHGQSFWHLL